MSHCKENLTSRNDLNGKESLSLIYAWKNGV